MAILIFPPGRKRKYILFVPPLNSTKESVGYETHAISKIQNLLSICRCGSVDSTFSLFQQTALLFYGPVYQHIGKYAAEWTHKRETDINCPR